MSLGKIPLKDKTLEVKSVEKSNSKGLFPSDMSLGNIMPPWHQFLDHKIRGAHFSLGIVAEERFAIELTPSTFSQRHVAHQHVFSQRHSWDRVPSPKRHVALRKESECCWGESIECYDELVVVDEDSLLVDDEHSSFVDDEQPIRISKSVK
ncbi:hypothetical protein Tco_1338554, partial [Tanacetum coccineum]